MSAPAFHLALPVDDLDSARAFYGDLLGCAEGRSAPRWVDFDFFGHQLSVHLAEGAGEEARNAVDGDDVPVRHFGVILPWADWNELHTRLAAAGQAFLIHPACASQENPASRAPSFCATRLEMHWNSSPSGHGSGVLDLSAPATRWLG